MAERIESCVHVFCVNAFSLPLLLLQVKRLTGQVTRYKNQVKELVSRTIVQLLSALFPYSIPVIGNETIV